MGTTFTGEFGRTYGFICIATDTAGNIEVQDPANVEATTKVVNLPPVAEAGGPYSGVVGSPIMFDASGSYDPDGSIVSYGGIGTMMESMKPARIYHP